MAVKLRRTPSLGAEPIRGLRDHHLRRRNHIRRLVRKRQRRRNLLLRSRRLLLPSLRRLRLAVVDLLAVSRNIGNNVVELTGRVAQSAKFVHFPISAILLLISASVRLHLQTTIPALVLPMSLIFLGGERLESGPHFGGLSFGIQKAKKGWFMPVYIEDYFAYNDHVIIKRY